MNAVAQLTTRDRAGTRSPARRSPRRWKDVFGFVIPPLLVMVAFVGVWYAASHWLLSPNRRFLLPPPHQVVRVAFLNSANRGELIDGLSQTASVALTGLAISGALGVLVAVVMSQARWLERSLYPYVVLLQTIPILALAPLIGLWLDYGRRAQIFVCVLISLFPIVNNTLFGLRSVAVDLRDLFAVHRTGRLGRLWKLELPSALPAMLAGFRISAGLSVIGAIVGDFFFRQGEPGVGTLLDLYRARLQSEQLYGAVLVSSLLGLGVFWIMGLLAHWIVGPWHDSADDRHLREGDGRNGVHRPLEEP